MKVVAAIKNVPLLLVLALNIGCQATSPEMSMMPRELAKTTLPTYTIEPPDILIIEALHIVPKAPYNLRTGDLISIQVNGTIPDAPIVGTFAIQSGGMVNLGHPYGTVKIAGQTIEGARSAIHDHLADHLNEGYVVLVSLLQISGLQQIAGQHLVGPDGTVSLGSYGSVPVVGMNLWQAKTAIEEHLSYYLDDPAVAVDVFAYNSKVYYIITQGAGLGDRVIRLPVTGNETVLDAISNVNGLSQISSKRMWIARPAPDNNVQVLPIDWAAVTGQASTTTNYQLMPGDRIFIAENKWVAWDNQIAKVAAPLERVMGFSLLSVGALTRFSGNVLGGGGNPGLGGF